MLVAPDIDANLVHRLNWQNDGANFCVQRFLHYLPGSLRGLGDINYDILSVRDDILSFKSRKGPSTDDEAPSLSSFD